MLEPGCIESGAHFAEESNATLSPKDLCYRTVDHWDFYCFLTHLLQIIMFITVFLIFLGIIVLSSSSEQ
jgi:hypothetical protein